MSKGPDSIPQLAVSLSHRCILSVVPPTVIMKISAPADTICPSVDIAASPQRKYQCIRIRLCWMRQQ
eukprot:1176562-Prorocentrum_minimum.AAC.4